MLQAPVMISLDLSVLEARFDRIDNAISALTTVVINLGARMDANLQKVLDDLDVIKQEAGDYIAARDAIDATKDATIADLTAQLAAAAAAGKLSAATIKDYQDGVAAAVLKADEDAALLKPPKNVPVLLAAFADEAAFLAAVGAYQTAGGTNGVTLDGATVGNAGTSGTTVDYFTQADGTISTVPL